MITWVLAALTYLALLVLIVRFVAIGTHPPVPGHPRRAPAIPDQET